MDVSFIRKSIDDSKLFSVFKLGKLKGPIAIAYNSDEWIEFAAGIPSLTPRDADLLFSALHFGLELEGLRSRMNHELPKLAPTDALEFVIAVLNVQTKTVITRTKQKLRNKIRKSEVAYMGEKSEVRIINSGNQSLNPDDYMSNFVDGMANILHHVNNSKQKATKTDRDNAISIAQKISMFVSIEQGLKELWGRAAWEGYRIRKSNDHLVFEASDEALAKLWLAWQRRFETIMLQESRLRAAEALARDDRTPQAPILAHSVLRLEDRPGQKQRYVVGTAREGGDTQTMALSAIESTYLKSFLDEVLPKHSQIGLTYRDLWKAWFVLQDLVRIHQARMPNRGLRSWEQVGPCALRFSVPRATKAIADALRISQSAAEVVMEIFSFDPDIANRKIASDLFQHGTWGRPVLRSGSHERGRIALASVVSPHPVMMMELWMTRTGMIEDPKRSQNKTVRGKVFERIGRERLLASGKKNNKLTKFGVSFLPLRGEGTEEIDALLRIGSTIVVCEMKCLNVPFGSIDRYNHIRKIEEAADQVIRKTKWSQANPDPIFDSLSIAVGERDLDWRFVPIVVLNSAFGAGLSLNDCAVTDLDWLSTFLGSSEVVVGGTFERGQGASMRSKSMYTNQADLEQRLIQIAVSPPSLDFELSRIEWELIPFPTRTGRPFLLKCPLSK